MFACVLLEWINNEEGEREAFTPQVVLMYLKTKSVGNFNARKEGGGRKAVGGAGCGLPIRILIVISFDILLRRIIGRVAAFTEREEKRVKREERVDTRSIQLKIS